MRAAARMLVAALLAAAAVAQVSTPIFSDADADAHAARSPLAWRAAARMVADDAGCGGGDGRVQTLSACREPSPALPPP